MSDDGRQGLTVIAFVGSVFSPYYASARRNGIAAAERHNAFNVLLHGDWGSRWCMTERTQAQLSRRADCMQIGNSSICWNGDALELQIAERGCPLPRAVRGTLVFHPLQRSGHSAALDVAGRHWWTPLAPQGRIEVRLQDPALSWSGNGYFDSNQGEEPLERAFRNWHWSRAATRNGSVVLYDVSRRKGEAFRVALRFDSAGSVKTLDGLESTLLPSTRWGIRRETRVTAEQARRYCRPWSMRRSTPAR